MEANTSINKKNDGAFAVDVVVVFVVEMASVQCACIHPLCGGSVV
jgi:hypothetical protein